MTTLLLVRHGENPANLTHDFSCRRVDYALTEKGWLQARQTARALAGRHPDALITSPLLRARQTARAIAQACSQVPIIIENLREMDVGDLEGRVPREDAWILYRDVLQQWLSGNNQAAFPAGESRFEIRRRFHQVVTWIAQEYPDQIVVAVGHGGLFTHGVMDVCTVPDERAFLGRENYNASITELETSRNSEGLTCKLVEWAATSHLSGQAADLVESVPEHARAKTI